MAKRRLGWGPIRASVGGYYGAYAYVVVSGASTWKISVGNLYVLVRDIGGGCADRVHFNVLEHRRQALFLTDLVEFFAMKPQIRSATPSRHPARFAKGSSSEVGFHYPGTERLVLRDLNFRSNRASEWLWWARTGRGRRRS